MLRTALPLAVLLGSTSAGAESAPPSGPVAPAPPVVASPPHIVAAPSPDASTRSQYPGPLRVGLGTALGFGVAPRAAVGLSADVGVYWPLAALPLAGISINWGMHWDPPAAGDVAGSTTGARVSISRAFATLNPCAHWWKLYGCPVFALGRHWGGGENVALQAQEFTPNYAAIGGRLGVEVPFAPHFGFRVFGELLGNLTSAAVLINERPGWTTPPTSGGVAAGLYFFWDPKQGS